jgi:hypothetical protein
MAAAKFLLKWLGKYFTDLPGFSGSEEGSK